MSNFWSATVTIKQQPFKIVSSYIKKNTPGSIRIYRRIFLLWRKLLGFGVTFFLVWVSLFYEPKARIRGIIVCVPSMYMTVVGLNYVPICWGHPLSSFDVSRVLCGVFLTVSFDTLMLRTLLQFQPGHDIGTTFLSRTNIALTSPDTLWGLLNNFEVFTSIFFSISSRSLDLMTL